MKHSNFSFNMNSLNLQQKKHDLPELKKKSKIHKNGYRLRACSASLTYPNGKKAG